MAREHWNDVPGDIAGEEADNLPGGFGTDNPDLSPTENIDDIVEGDIIAPSGRRHLGTGEPTVDNIVAASHAAGTNTGATVDPAILAEGEEGHPGAVVGMTGREREKRIPPGTPVTERHLPERPSLGGESGEPGLTAQQRRNMSTESEFAGGTEGAAGGIEPGDKAA